MSTNNTNTANDDVIGESLDDFASELFGGSNEASGNAKPEATQDYDDIDDGESEEPELDTQDSDDEEEDLDEVSEDDDTLAPETDEDDESDDSEDEDDEPQPKKKKKNRFQERIDELTAARKEAERKAEQTRLEYEKRIAALEAKLEGNTEEPKGPKDAPKQEATGRPQPDAKTEDGTPKYPLGEYDPKYMQDLMEHMLNEKEQAQKQQAELSEQEKQKQAMYENLQRDWNTKLETARERYPDFQQKGEQMLTVFEGIDESYGEYLTTTLMEMDNGPDVFYYLSNNIDEAQEIVAAGPKKATMALARLEAKLSDGGRKGRSKTKVSKAKSPPPANKGAAVATPKSVEKILESGDLSAFERELFRPK